MELKLRIRQTLVFSLQKKQWPFARRMGVEEGLQYDIEAAAVAFKSFNRYLLDDWGYNYSDRIYSAHRRASLCVWTAARCKSIRGW